jgi:hypothetical protein
MDIHLRIPVTSEQKALIDEATADEADGMAAWARAILLAAARRRVGKRKGRKATDEQAGGSKDRVAQ